MTHQHTSGSFHWQKAVVGALAADALVAVAWWIILPRLAWVSHGAEVVTTTRWVLGLFGITALWVGLGGVGIGY